ncbi:MAG TPA: 2-phosphosulfolactate phosphatase [Burkholderiales bacterium]|nr:2-phosphosulfolactate phosphatase [Burkholderiales bacterium]
MSDLFKHKVHVLFRKEDLDRERLEGKVAIVLDVLFATSTIITALAHGASEVIPTLDEAGANAEAQKLPRGSYVLAGELYAETLPGFASPTPLALLKENIAGRTLIYSTTNGTVALRQSSRAEHVYAAALLNGEAVVERVLRNHRGQTILIVCSGSMGMVNLEDLYGAGYLVDLLSNELEESSDFSDAALAARSLFRAEDAADCLLRARVGRMMIERGLAHEVHYAATLSTLAAVPKLVGGRLMMA